MKHILIAILILSAVGCTKAIAPQIPIEKVFYAEKQKIVFARYEYQIKTIESGKEVKNEDRF